MRWYKKIHRGEELEKSREMKRAEERPPLFFSLSYLWFFSAVSAISAV
jgi:hypothetical protein